MRFAHKVPVKRLRNREHTQRLPEEGPCAGWASTEHALDGQKPALVLPEAEGRRILRLFMVTTNTSTLGWEVINHKKTFWHKYTTKGKKHAISPDRFLGHLVLS